jgi:predicted AlkP superfamily phosphohydrolase/phosphomutase
VPDQGLLEHRGLGEVTRIETHDTWPARTLVIGLSGCSWNVLEPLLDAGELPNLAELRDTGASAVLQSVVPFQAAPAWASYATGVSPGIHGCYDLVAPDGKGRLRVVRGDDLRAPTYYEQLGREGRRSVLVNLPIDQAGCEGAVIVNSWLTVDESRRILPLGRRERYRRLLEAQRIVPTTPHDLDEICAVDQTNFDLVRELCLHEEWDHLFVLFSASDWLGHAALGRLLRGNGDARAAFVRLYRQLDSHVGWLRAHSGDAVTVVLSEHGMAEERAVLRVNTVLDRLGLVQTRDGEHPSIDTASSRAYSPTDASFAVFTPGERRLESIVGALESVKLLDGTPAINGIWKTHELAARPARAGEPSLLFEPAAGVRPSAALKERAVAYPPSRGLGCHDREGVLLLAGPGVKPGPLAPASICDLAPTLLALMGAGEAGPVEGRVLREALEPVPPAGRSGGGFRHLSPAADNQQDTVTRRLRDLGYI